MHPRELGGGVVVLDVGDVRFAEVPAPALDAAVRSARDDAWASAVADNPTLFDGPVVLCDAIDVLADGIAVRWARASYRWRTLRGRTDAPALASVFVCVVQPTTDGRLVMGSMSEATSNPRIIQFPGGTLEPPAAGVELTMAKLREHAVRELYEETGVVVAEEHLAFWSLVRTSNGNLGFFFRAPAIAADAVSRARSLLVAADAAAGRVPEFADVALIADTGDLASLGGRAADYVLPLLERYRGRDTGSA